MAEYSKDRARKRLKELREKEGLWALIIGMVSTILLFWGIFQISESIIDKIPNVLIPAIYTGIIYLIVEKIQGNEIKKHKEENNEFYSNWKAVGIGLIWTIVLMGGIFTYVYYGPQDAYAKAYDTELEKFHNNEAEAMKVFDMLHDSPAYEIVYFIEHTGIPKWQENIEIVNKMSKIENLPEEFQKQNKLLLEYCKLRIEAYNLMLKSMLNDTSEYDEEITEKHVQIEKIIDEL